MKVAFVTINASVVIEETGHSFMASEMFACYMVLFCSCRFSNHWGLWVVVSFLFHGQFKSFAVAALTLWSFPCELCFCCGDR